MIQNTDINKATLPKHVAIIMDGNGRWAKKQSKIRIFGHKVGVKAVRDTVEGAVELGLKYLTLYAFSSENSQVIHDEAVQEEVVGSEEALNEESNDGHKEVTGKLLKLVKIN